jgi:HNH endonuclease/NUMOD4 motif
VEIEMQKKKERWKEIAETSGDYSVSTIGRVSRDTPNHGARPGRILSQRLGQGGYPVVRLRINGKSHTRYVHRLVAIAFIGNPPFDGAQVNHKDMNRLNPRLENLEYLSHAENQQHSWLNGRIALRGEQKSSAKLKEKDVVFIRKSKSSIKELAMIYGVSHHAVYEIRKRMKWKHVA